MSAPTEPTTTHQVKALATDWVRPFYFETFADALIHVTLDVGERIVAMRERYTRETPGFVQYGAVEDDDWVIIESGPTDSASSGHATHPDSFTVNAPCPDCGQFTIVGYMLRNEHGNHMHTRYVCNFWKANPPELLAKMTSSMTRPCEWNGWTVPTAAEDYQPPTAQEQPTSEPRPDVVVAKLDELITAVQSSVMNAVSELSGELTYLRETVEQLTPPAPVPMSGEEFGH